MKTSCLYCSADIVTVYNIPYKFCLDKDCRQRYSQQKLLERETRLLTCQVCDWSWRPRSAGVKPSFCPKCKSTKWDGFKGVPKADEEFVLCHICGSTKLKGKIYCGTCGKRNGELTHYCGVTKANWQKQLEFLRNYQGSDPMLVAFKRIVTDIQTPQTPVVEQAPEATQDSETQEPEERELSIAEAMDALEHLPWEADAIGPDGLRP